MYSQLNKGGDLRKTCRKKTQNTWLDQLPAQLHATYDPLACVVGSKTCRINKRMHDKPPKTPQNLEGCVMVRPRKQK